jgi:hypothetical protein
LTSSAPRNWITTVWSCLDGFTTWYSIFKLCCEVVCTSYLPSWLSYTSVCQCVYEEKRTAAPSVLQQRCHKLVSFKHVLYIRLWIVLSSEAKVTPGLVVSVTCVIQCCSSKLMVLGPLILLSYNYILDFGFDTHTILILFEGVGFDCSMWFAITGLTLLPINLNFMKSCVQFLQWESYMFSDRTRRLRNYPCILVIYNHFLTIIWSSAENHVNIQLTFLECIIWYTCLWWHAGWTK